MRDKTILLIEDNADDAHLTLAAFKEAGIPAQFVVETDGPAALQHLAGAAEMPAVVLLDLKLHKLTGHEILERIRSNPRTKYLPVVMLTSSVETEDLFRCYALGANSFVRKPVDFEQFLEMARLIGRYWLQVNVPAPLRP
jgi:two-component system response regulator